MKNYCPAQRARLQAMRDMTASKVSTKYLSKAKAIREVQFEEEYEN